MEIKLSSKLTRAELFHFLMFHTYQSLWGFAGILISVCAFIALISQCMNGGSAFSIALTAAAALLFLFVQPLYLLYQSYRIMELDEGYQAPIQYQFDHAGIHLEQKGDTAFYGWQEVTKVVSSKRIVAIYLGKSRVFKISRTDFSDSYEEFKTMVRTFAVQAFVKLK